MGCKRVLFTSDWYSTLMRPDVDLHTGGIERITAGGVLDSAGVERPADAIIWGTGFRSHDFVAPMDVTGMDGADLNEQWAERPEAYLGMAMSAASRTSSSSTGRTPITARARSPTRSNRSSTTRIDAFKRLRTDGLRYLDLKPETQMRWREEMAERSVPTRWTQGGCHSWYLNGEGVNTNNWPGPWLEFHRRTQAAGSGRVRSGSLIRAVTPGYAGPPPRGGLVQP